MKNSISLLLIAFVLGLSYSAHAVTMEPIDSTSTTALLATRSPVRCSLFANGYFQWVVDVPQGYYISDSLWLSNVNVKIKSVYSSSAVAMTMVDSYYTLSRATSRFSAGISRVDGEVIHQVDTNKGPQYLRLRCVSL